MENTGLILEGGGMRGAFTAGVLDFLMEKDVRLNDIYAVSAGACQACNYLSNQKGRGLRVWTDYVHDKRYCSLRSLLRTGDLFGAEMSYDLVPNQYDVFDYDEYQRRNGRFIAVVTNVETGKAEYLQVKDMRRDIQMVRASSSAWRWLSWWASSWGSSSLGGAWASFTDDTVSYRRERTSRPPEKSRWMAGACSSRRRTKCAR